MQILRIAFLDSAQFAWIEWHASKHDILKNTGTILRYVDIFIKNRLGLRRPSRRLLGMPRVHPGDPWSLAYV